MTERFDALMDGWKAALLSFFEPTRKFFDIFSDFWISFGVIGAAFILLLLYCILTRGRDFRDALKQPRTMVVCALMIALNIVLGYFSIPVSAYLRIGFGFMTQPVVTMLYGPLMGCLTGIAQDFLSYLLNPMGGAYIPSYGLCVGFSGMLYGLVLHNRPVRLGRVFLAKLLVIGISNILLNTIALAPTAGSGFVGILPARILKNLLLLPIQTVIVYLLLRFVEKLPSKV